MTFHIKYVLGHKVYEKCLEMEKLHTLYSVLESSTLLYDYAFVTPDEQYKNECLFVYLLCMRSIIIHPLAL